MESEQPDQTSARADRPPILVTGATGRQGGSGRAVVRRLAEAGRRPVRHSGPGAGAAAGGGPVVGGHPPGPPQPAGARPVGGRADLWSPGPPPSVVRPTCAAPI